MPCGKLALQCVHADCAYFCHLGLATENVTVSDVSDTATLTRQAGKITIVQDVAAGSSYAAEIAYPAISATSVIIVSVSSRSTGDGIPVVFTIPVDSTHFTLVLANAHTAQVLDGTTVVSFLILDH